MLVSRSMRYLASHCRPASVYTTGSIRTKTLGVQHIATTWYVKAPTMTAAYSTNPKNVFNSLLLIPKRMDSTSATKPKIIPSNMDSESNTNVTPTTSLTSKPYIESPSSIPPSNVASQSISDNPPKQINTSESQAKSNPMPPSKPPIPDSRIQPPNINMPSREQVEKYFFTALVYVWDFSYYVFSLTLRLIDTYILKNPTLQENWKKLMKRLDEQREAIKSKK